MTETETASTSGSFGDLAVEEPFEGVRRRSFDSGGATVTEYVFDPGGRFPIHRHPQEQITLIQEGEVELTVAGETSTLRAGDWSVVAPDVEHGITAPGGARFVAVVVPRRVTSDSYTIVT
jgi:quercetin dioxygenase-like cupin family protein